MRATYPAIRRSTPPGKQARGFSLIEVLVAMLVLAIGLLGVAAITLGMQATRKMSGVPVEGFWIVVGVGFAVASAWQWFEVDKPLAPIVLIAIGVALLVWRVWPWSRRSNGR